MLERFEKNLVKVESIIAAASLFLLLALSLFQIFTRNVLDFGYAEIEIINRNLLIICGAMGAVLATSKLRHIKIDALTVIMSERQISLLRCPLSLFSAIVCLMMSYYAGIFFMDEWQYAPANERWALPFNLIYPFGFGLLSLHFLLICFKKPRP
ncbi:MAG: TRAP transporter small permease subunit [Gammaproteobacteria bacterium]|nr:TRAP transporter small permease subunit [Gammaproteobacteria bacterium]NNJ50024.1 TRAP transporter small permease subunit [Gammaproteobacteria bacterium]